MRPNEIPSYDTIHIHFVLTELEHLKNQPNTINKLLSEANIDPHLLSNPNARVTSKQYFKLFTLASEALDDELAGFGRLRLPKGYFKTLCRYSLHGKNLLSCLARATSFSNLFRDITGFNVFLLSDKQTTSLAMTQTPGSTFSKVIVERTFMNIFKYFVWLSGRHIQLKAVKFSFPAPTYMDEYRQFFYCPLEFNSQQNALVFHTQDLYSEPTRNEQDASEILELAPVSLWENSVHTHSFTAMVRHALAAPEKNSAHDQQAIAKQLGVSTVTLRRRLTKEGTSFQKIKDEFRRDRAISLLLDKSRSVADIAHYLGYSEPSAFFRAFKLWVGVTPREYRSENTHKHCDQD